MHDQQEKRCCKQDRLTCAISKALQGFFGADTFNLSFNQNAASLVQALTQNTTVEEEPRCCAEPRESLFPDVATVRSGEGNAYFKIDGPMKYLSVHSAGGGKLYIVDPLRINSADYEQGGVDYYDLLPSDEAITIFPMAALGQRYDFPVYGWVERNGSGVTTLTAVFDIADVKSPDDDWTKRGNIQISKDNQELGFQESWFNQNETIINPPLA